MNKLEFRPAPWRIAVSWVIAVVFLSIAASIYISVFWLPFRGLDLKKCPAACTQNSDCWVPGCSKKTECHDGKCRPSAGHKVFFSASVMGLLTILGIIWVFLSLFKMKLHMVVDEAGIHFHRVFLADIHIDWESLLGITYHGVNTRLGREATIYSIAGDTGLFSFLVMGLPKGASTREIELGAFFMLHLSAEQHGQLVALIEEKTGHTPEPEHEW